MPKRNKEEWLIKLLEQISFLEDFANRYDNEQLHYAIEMAVKLRVLLDYNSTKKEKSLLQNLCSAYLLYIPEFLNNSHFPLSMQHEKVSNFVRSNLCIFTFTLVPNEPPFAYPKPNMGNRGNLSTKSFNTWWEKVTAISIGDEEHTILTRKDVVRLICDKEGGAHVDAKIPSKLTALMRNEAKPLTIIANNTTRYIKLDELLYATIRQITYETIQTLKPFLYHNGLL